LFPGLTTKSCEHRLTLVTTIFMELESATRIKRIPIADVRQRSRPASS